MKNPEYREIYPTGLIGILGFYPYRVSAGPIRPFHNILIPLYFHWRNHRRIMPGGRPARVFYRAGMREFF
ncbi:MAG: hypothetical protein CVV34_01100 [Methanomicrobiales archaeon HGW-Methanomicrobiales-5]|nr:MAG: hypothetical protein CVV34_01100 [Methanomicrobiales archaeon HGW-Methanomicrobiales-5]